MKLTQFGPGCVFPTNLDLANILGDTDLDFDNFYFFYVLDPTFLNFQDLRSPNSQISRFPDFQTPPDELSDPNLTPLPTHLGFKYITRALAATASTLPTDLPNGRQGPPICTLTQIELQW